MTENNNKNTNDTKIETNNNEQVKVNNNINNNNKLIRNNDIRTQTMVLNENTNTTKTISLRNISSIYRTKDTEYIEIVGDYILLGDFSHNAILKSIKISTLASISITGNIVLLNRDKKEFSYINSSGTETTLSPLKSNLSLNSVLNSVEQLNNSMKFKTLEEYILEETGEKAYIDQVYVALKIISAPSVAVKDLKFLTEIDFIEKF